MKIVNPDLTKQVLTKTEKRFDFVIKTDKKLYLIETNFYANQGSKLNETARSYKTLAQEVVTIDGFTFIWFTNGCPQNIILKKLLMC